MHVTTVNLQLSWSKRSSYIYIYIYVYIYIYIGEIKKQRVGKDGENQNCDLWPQLIGWKAHIFFNFMRELSILSFPWVVRGNECVFYFPRAPRTRSEGVPRVPACWQGSFNWAIKTMYQWGCVGEFCFMATKKPRRSLSPLTLSIVRKSQSYWSKKNTWKFHLHVWA